MSPRVRCVELDVLSKYVFVSDQTIRFFFIGPVPEEMASLEHLVYFELMNNRLSGRSPNQFLTQVRRILWYGNRFS